MKENLNDLRTFLLVAETKSFTKASARLGVSTSAISHLIKGLEERLKIKLFHRTTRSIATTEAGEHLYKEVAPLFDDIDSKINELSTFRNALTGTLRINASDYAYLYPLREKFVQFMKQYPEVELELVSDNRFVNIVEERFDAGIRLGNEVEKDMIAVKISDEMQMCVVATPNYLAIHGTPKTPHELVQHHCLRIRLQSSGGIMQWEFIDPQNSKHIIKVMPKSQLIASNNRVLHRFALEDLGLIWVPADSVKDDIDQGRFVTVLDDWAICYESSYLYYPNRRQNSPLFKALIDALRLKT